jgi:very-short-patch-repair endonuclease
VFATSRRTIERARRERRSGNLPEVMLWRVLRSRPGGFKFRRQHPIDCFILDFACLSARLAIEIDGEMHHRGERPERDQARDARLARLGFLTLRLPACDVLADVDGVAAKIVAACLARAPLHHQPAAGGSPPRSGEVSEGLLS